MPSQVRNIYPGPTDLAVGFRETFDSGAVTIDGETSASTSVTFPLYTDLGLDVLEIVTTPTTGIPQAYRLTRAVAEIQWHVGFTTTHQITWQIRYSDTLPTHLNTSGSVLNTWTQVAGTESVASSELMNNPSGRYFWFVVTGANSGNVIDARSVGADGYEQTAAAMLLTDTSKYQVWNNGPGPIYFASAASAPGTDDGILLRYCDHIELTKLAAENFYAWTDYSKARVAVMEA